MDRSGNKSARTEVSAIKVVAARLQTRVVDRAIQVFGAMDLTPDTPLAFLYTWGWALRFTDGPTRFIYARLHAKSSRKPSGTAVPWPTTLYRLPRDPIAET
jgi:acyl-CoA dehydrogenase